MHFVKIGTRSINLHNVTHVEEQHWHDSSTVKIHFAGQGNTPPLVLTEEEAKQLADYLGAIAEQPLAFR